MRSNSVGRCLSFGCSEGCSDLLLLVLLLLVLLLQISAAELMRAKQGGHALQLYRHGQVQTVCNNVCRNSGGDNEGLLQVSSASVVAFISRPLSPR
jgi:hypothetical protein